MPAGLALEVGNDGAARYLFEDTGGIAGATVDASCKLLRSPEDVAVHTITALTSKGSLSIQEVLGRARWANLLCRHLISGRVMAIDRTTWDRVSGRKDIADACAFSGDGKVLSVAERTGRWRQIPLQAGARLRFDRHTMPVAPGRVVSLVLDRAGETAAILKDDGSAWIAQHTRENWLRVVEKGGRAPLAMSADGKYLAFANDRSEIETWRIMEAPPPLPNRNRSGSAVAGGETVDKLAPTPPSDPVLMDPAEYSAGKVSLATKIYFDYDKVMLRPDIKATLDEFASKLRTFNLEVVIVVAHSGYQSNEAYRDKLAIRMADSVKAYLVSIGVDPSRVYTESKGGRQPVASRNTPEGRALNNRVEIEAVGTRGDEAKQSSDR
jgi:outer membrane protein OmpA-like peptidoglycan-associated protein